LTISDTLVRALFGDNLKLQASMTMACACANILDLMQLDLTFEVRFLNDAPSSAMVQ
jgi:hypothetical protein